MIMRSPKPSRHPQTLESDHAKVVPPHCKARSRHTNAASKSKAPGISSLASFCVRDIEGDEVGAIGILPYNAMIMNAISPIAISCQ